MGTKWEFWGFGWPAVGGFGGEWPAVVFWWWVRRWVVVGVGGFGFREERDGDAVSGELYGRRKNGGRGGKCDLKAGHKRPETEYVRTYTCAFDRTRAGEWCVCACDVRTYLSKFERTRAVQWVCEGRGGRTHKGKVERSA
jgi:hypothetical protein